MDNRWNVAVLVGSLRKESLNRKMAKALVKLAPPSLRLEIVEIGNLPLYNQDDDANPPAASVAFKARIEQTDAVLFVTPEYNRSVPGVLKNAIDIASRPYSQSSFNGIPVAFVGNSPGALGAVSAVKHLQQIMPGISGPVMQQPEMYLNGIGDAFDDKGELTKAPVRDLLTSYLAAFAAHVAKHKN